MNFLEKYLTRFRQQNPEEENKIIPDEDLDFGNWLERLSDSERAIFEERAAIIEYDGGLEREQAEIEAIKRIIKERVIPGKCDKCKRVNGCILTSGQRELCGGPF